MTKLNRYLKSGYWCAAVLGFSTSFVAAQTLSTGEAIPLRGPPLSTRPANVKVNFINPLNGNILPFTAVVPAKVQLMPAYPSLGPLNNGSIQLPGFVYAVGNNVMSGGGGGIGGIGGGIGGGIAGGGIAGGGIGGIGGGIGGVGGGAAGIAGGVAGGIGGIGGGIGGIGGAGIGGAGIGGIGGAGIGGIGGGFAYPGPSTGFGGFGGNGFGGIYGVLGGRGY